MSGVSPLVNRTRQTVSLIRHPLLKVYSVEGESNCGYLRLLIADDGVTLPYMLELLFPDGAKVSAKGHVNARKAQELARSQADVIIVGANLLLTEQYKSAGFYIVPRWVRLMLPVVDDPYARLYDFGRQTRKYFKWMLKKVKDAGFECETVTDSAWFDAFYNDMYKPYAEQRYGGSAVIHSYRKVKRAFERGAGIIAKKDGKPVAGTIVSRYDDVLHIPHVGVLGADPAPVREGALFAMDYYIVQYAHDTGCRVMDFGHSRPFLSDGPLKYKLNWHMDVLDDDDGVGFFAIKPGHSDQSQRFFEANPFFFMTEQGLRSFDEQI